MGIKREVERQRAIQLRLEGKSYNEIRKTLGVLSKGTISYWLKGLVLSPAAKKKLKLNTQRAHERGFFLFNSERTARIEKENTEAVFRGRSSIGKLTTRELSLITAALYWGEGTKKASKANQLLAFVNSDPKMIAVFLKFVREALHVPEEKIRAGIHLYDSTTDVQGKKFWSRITKLPQDRFWIVRQVSRASKGVRDRRSLPFGTLVVKINDRKLFHYMLGMIEGLKVSSGADRC